MTEHPGHDDAEALDRVLREAEAAGHLAELRKGLGSPVDESLDGTPAGATVDMNPLIAYLNANGVTTTYFSGGLMRDGRIVSRPHVMFPHLGQIEEALQLFEILARHLGDDDMVQAIYNPVREVEIHAGEQLLHAEQGGFRTSGGRIVSCDNTWAVEIDAAEYEKIWVSGLRTFDRPVPDRLPVGDHAWRFSVHLPMRHAEALTLADDR